MFSHRMVTLNLPIQSIGIGTEPPFSPPSPPPPIAADRKSEENNDDDDDDEEEVEEEELEVEGFLDELVDLESFLGGAACIK